MARRPKSRCALRPDPTAVAPNGSSYKPVRALLSLARPYSSCAAQVATTSPSMIGVASCRWVRPNIGISLQRPGTLDEARLEAGATASSSPSSASSVARCITVGNTSFDD